MPAIAIQSACSFSPDALLRIVIAGTGLQPCKATLPGVFEYSNIDVGQWVTVRKRLADLQSRGLIAAIPVGGLKSTELCVSSRAE